MGRKPKCTVEEKISAVEDYLNGIRSVSQIMVDLSIKSTRTIRVWILAYQNGGIEAIFPVTANHSYSKEFKNEMVQRYIDGEGSVTDLCADMGFLHMLHYKTGFRCIMPIENLGIMNPIALLGVAVLITYSPQNGAILLVMAFLISPMGLPLAAIWLLGKVQSLKFAIQDWVYG